MHRNKITIAVHFLQTNKKFLPVLNRRQIRIKVMQSIYAMHQSGSDNLEKQEKFLLNSIENSLDLYLILITILPELQKKEIDFIEKSKLKHLATPEEKNPNLKFVNNAIFSFLEDNNALSIALEKHKVNNWQANDDLILSLLQEVKQSDLYQNYMVSKTSGFNEDRDFVINLFEKVIAPNEILYHYLEDFKLTWIDDIPVVNTLILKQLGQLSAKENSFKIPPTYKDEDDKDFAISLFRKTVLNEEKLAKEFSDKTPNWDISRIAEIDTIVLKMAICELLNFHSIPVKVTINEYLEIVKEYSTPKSSTFINGILDTLVKEFQTNNKLNKVGRGLL